MVNSNMVQVQEPQPGLGGPRPARPGGAPPDGDARPGRPGPGLPGPGGLPGLDAAPGAPPIPVVAPAVVAPPAPAPRPPDRDRQPRQADRPRPPEPQVQPEGPEQTGDRIWLYPETVNITPAADTRHALYRSMMNINRQWLQDGEVRRMSIARASAIPIIGGLVGGLLKPFAARGYYDVTLPGGVASRVPRPPGFPPASTVGLGGSKIDYIPPTTAETLVGAAQNVGVAGLIAGVLSPIASGLRRLTGENAFSQFARFANRREDRGLISRLAHGAESRLLKWLFLREDRDTAQLLRIMDQGTDVNRINIGSRERLNNLISAGVMAEMKAQMVAEHNIQLSQKETDRINRWHDAFRLSQRIYDAKIPTPGQRQIYINDILPDLLRNRERALYAQQTTALAGIGAVKAAGIALLGHVFAFENIHRLALAAGDVAKGVYNWGYKTVANVAQPAGIHLAQIPDNIANWAAYITGTGAYAGYGARGPGSVPNTLMGLPSMPTP